MGAPQEPRQTVPYIPGLSLESANNAHKKSPKRRKKKTKQERSNEDSDYLKSSSPDEMDNLKANDIQHERTGECFMEAPVEPIHEIHLTDALADFLVNPPTDQEVSNEEEKNISFISRSQSPPHNEESKEKSNESENSSETKAEVANEIIEVEIEDEEICEITQNIEEIKFSEIKFDSGEKIAEEDKPECIENIIDAVDVVNVSMNSGEEHNIDADNIVKTECVLSEMECETGKSEQSKTFKNKEQGKKPLNKQTKISKKFQKLTVKSKKALQESEDPILLQNTDSPAESKMSYSSVIKSNLIKEPKPIPPTTSQPKAEPVPIPSPLPTSSISQATTTTHQDYDKWEKVPPSVSKPENWEKTSMKRKNKKKNMRFEDSSLTDEIPDLEVVSKIEEQTSEVLIKEESKVLQKYPSEVPEKEESNVLIKDVSNLPEKGVTEVLDKESVPDEENTNTEETDQEKKKVRRRRKKHGSEDPEESSAGRRIVICDDQIEMENSRAMRRASELVNSSLIDTLKPSGYFDFLVVNELGSGISRGCMNFGRLYQGKYIPPERTDGLIAEFEEDESAEIEEDIVEDSQTRASADIDLD